MTIAAGFRCIDGVAICADSQETFPDYLKTTSSKIKALTEEGKYKICVTGSGPADMIDMVYELIMEKVMEATETNTNVFHQIVRDVVHDVTINHVLPFPKDDRPYFDLIIAIQCKGEPVKLLKTSGTAVRRIEDFGAVGSVALAHYSTGEYDFLYLPLCIARGFAINMVRRVKDYDPNCGKKTELILLYDDFTFHQPTRKYVAIVEQELARLDELARHSEITLHQHHDQSKGVNEAIEHYREHALKFQEWERQQSDESCRLKDKWLEKSKFIYVNKKLAQGGGG